MNNELISNMNLIMENLIEKLYLLKNNDESTSMNFIIIEESSRKK